MPLLYQAAHSGRTDIVRELVALGAKVCRREPERGKERGREDKKRRRGTFTPLHAAAANGHAETVRFLVEMGADVHRRGEGGGEGEGGYTALYMAVCGGHKGCVRALVEMGAKVDERSGRETDTPHVCG